jgi:MFS family permease
MAVYVACVGMVCTGAGLSVVIPVVSSASGDIPNVRPSDAIATITSVSYIGYLIGPPCFGALSDTLGGLQWALCLVGVFTIFITLMPGQPPRSRYVKESASFSSSSLIWPQKSDEMSAGQLSRTLTNQGYAGF